MIRGLLSEMKKAQKDKNFVSGLKTALQVILKYKSDYMHFSLIVLKIEYKQLIRSVKSRKDLGIGYFSLF